MNKTGDQNLREFTRVPINARVEVKTGEVSFNATKTIDLSMKGVSLIADQILPLETKCAVTIFLGNGDLGITINVKGKVKRSVESGMAIEFTEIDLDSYEYLQNLLMHNSQTVHDVVEEEIHSHLGLKRRS
ncbi:MAG: PilZ domain-containing protein [Nitrospinae bacterium]|nr:PilZ domain-containing protein [Nitrospinota bacterium]